MASAAQDIDGLSARWLRASFFGWLLGLVGVILLALLGDLVLPGNAQFMVGVGVGAGVGFFQSRTLSAWLPQPGRWMAASTVGMASLFVVHDLARIVDLEVPFSLPLYVMGGALLTGLWQRSLLRPLSPRANWWVPVSLIAWMLPATGLALSEWEAAGFAGDLSGPVVIIFGGLLLGAASGRPLVWLLRHPAV